MLDALQYTPRQDGQDRGNVADYALYVSDSADRWDTAAAKGTFAAGGGAKLVEFAPQKGRFVRFVATREVGGREWTSVAELDLRGARL
jgi:hexosaminidase